MVHFVGVGIMKKKLSLFNRYASAKASEEAMFLLHSTFHKILKLNLKKNTFEEIKVIPEEKHVDKGYSHHYSEWVKNFAMTGNVHKDDIQTYLNFTDIEQIKKLFNTRVKKYTLKYRRSINNDMRWVEMDLVPSENFGQKNQTVFLYVYDIHDSLVNELNTTKLMTTIARAITKSYLACIYLDLEKDFTRIVYASDFVREFIDETQPIRDILALSIKTFTNPMHQQRMNDFCNIETLQERLGDKNVITTEYLGSKGGICRASFIPVRFQSDTGLKSVIYVNQYVEGEVLDLRNQLETEKTLVECLTSLSGLVDFDSATQNLLRNIGNFYGADRASIFSIDYQKNVCMNSHEWCKDGIPAKKASLQSVPVSALKNWIELFEKSDYVRISNTFGELDPNSPEARILHDLEINNLFTVPFRDSMKRITGFIGVENPSRNINSEIVLRTISTYIMEEIIKKNYTDELYKLSYSDSMTGTYNRAAYIRDMDKISKNSSREDNLTGILYADVNGLKITNDTRGHEAGDLLIENAVSLLRKYFKRKDDSIYRLGGDEFVVLSNNILQKEFYTKVENLKDELEHNWILSCGGTWFNKITDVDSCTKLAEQAMYQNKSDYYKANPRTDRRQ